MFSFKRIELLVRLLFILALLSILLCTCLPWMVDLQSSEVLKISILFAAAAVVSILFLVLPQILLSKIFARNINRRDRLLDCFRRGILNPKIFGSN